MTTRSRSLVALSLALLPPWLVACRGRGEIRRDDQGASGLPSTSASVEAPGAMPRSTAVDPVIPVPSASASAEPPEERVRSRSGRLSAFERDDELWIADARGERRLVPKGPLVVENRKANLPPLDTSSGFESPQFSPDEMRVYFTRYGWGTSRALFYAEVDTGKVFFFHDANGYKVIDQCTDKAQLGRVITYEHSYFDVNPMSATDLFVLVDGAQPQPSELRTGGSGRRGLIGYDDENVARFLAVKCGVGAAPPAPPPTELPPRLRGQVVRCKEFTMRRDDLKFLDGTTQIRFRTSTGPGKSDVVFDVNDAEQLCTPP